MIKTFNRQPISVSTSSSNYPKQMAFTQAEFKGICDDKNDIVTDQHTFADADNVYVDEGGTLVSRAPLKFNGECFIIEEWNFDTYILRLQKLLKVINDITHCVYVLRCVSHTTKEGDGQYPYYTWAIPADIIGNFVPNVNCTQIEDKVFIWFAGIDFVAFNTTGEKPYFEDATKYLYLPTHKQIVNGIETEVETKNFLTDAYKKRFHYSAYSDVDFNTLIDKDLEIYFAGTAENVSEHLYDITVVPEQEKTLIYPVSHVGENYYFDMVQTARANVFMRYNIVSQSIEVSFDGRYFKALPVIANILGEPLITRDGTHIIAFTKNGVAQCKIVEDETDETLFVWVVYPYDRRGIPVSSTSYIPRGYFESIDTFVYIRNNNVYAECPGGDGNILHAQFLVSSVGTNNIKFKDDDIKLKLFYTTDMSIVAEDELYKDKPGMIIVALGDTTDDEMTIDVFGIQFILVKGNDADAISVSHKALISNNSITPAKPYNVSDISIIPVSSVETPNLVNRRGYDILLVMKAPLNGTVFMRYPHDVTYTDNIHMDWSGYAVLDGSSNKYILTERNDYVLMDNQVVALNGYFSGSQNDGTAFGIISIPNTPDMADDTVMAVGMHIELQNLRLRVFGLTDDAKSLRQGVLRSNDLIVAAPNAVTARDFLTTKPHSYRFYLEKLENKNGELSVADGYVRVGDLVRLRAYDEPVNGIEPWVYPQAPSSWEVGDEWPTKFKTEGIPQPYGWKAGDALPTGPVVITDTLKIIKQPDLLAINDEGVWLNINGTLWTSQISENTILYLDESMNSYISGGQRYVDVKDLVPDHSATLGEYYFAFNNTDNTNSLQVTSTRRNIDNLYDDDSADFLLYLPKRDEQKFAGKITALHPLSDTQIGIFTNEAIWYVSKVILDDATVAYTTATKSRIPVGCRDGDEVITALDGQALLFPTQRGITIMAPQDFVATTEKSLNYLSDNIQKIYFDFYNKPVKHINGDVKSMIKSVIYKYWVLFYRVMDKQILLLDTRNSCWWKLSTPYPIKDITASARLQLVMQVDVNKGASLEGVSYLFADLEDTTYQDDIVDAALSGDYKEVYENEFIGSRRVVLYAEPTISWYLESQKLHLYKPDNYKAVKGININLQGTQSNTFNLLTKVYRDLYNPVKDETIEVNVDEISTFVYRLNLMHAAFFQYALRNDEERESHHRLCLNSLTIKYEVKEKIR